MNTRFTVALAVLALAACPGAQKLPDAAPATPVVAGAFANEGCLSSPNADGTTSYTTVAYQLSAGSWSSDTVFYGDEKCAAKQGTVHAEGPLTLGAPSMALPGAIDVELAFTRRTMTPHVDGFVASMQSAGCGKAPYAVNEPQDILAGGCKDLGFPACAEREFNVLKIDADAVTFGKHAADGMCTAAERPSELGVVLKRVP